MAKYKVTCSDIEWDVEEKDEYNPDVVAALPKEAIVYINAPDKSYAKEWGMNDVSSNHGFCIQGCKVKAEKI